MSQEEQYMGSDLVLLTYYRADPARGTANDCCIGELQKQAEHVRTNTGSYNPVCYPIDSASGNSR